MRGGRLEHVSPQGPYGRRFGPLVRRGGGGRGGPPFSGGGNIAKKFLALFDPVAKDCWFDADLTIPAGDKTYALVDRIDASHYLHQPTPGTMPSLPVAESGFGGAKGITFTATASTYLYSTRSLASWKFAHEGSGYHGLLVWKSLGDPLGGYYMSTVTGGAISGIAVANVTGINLAFSVINGGPNVLTGSSAQGDYFAAGSVGVIESWFGAPTAPSPRWGLKNTGRTIASGDSLLMAASTANPPAVLNVGRRGNGTAHVNGVMRSLYMFHRALTSAEYAIARAFIKADTGNAVVMAA